MNRQNDLYEKASGKSLIELAKLIMSDEREELNFNDIFKRVAKLKGLNEDEKAAKIGQFYTDINMDGSFVTNGANRWGLKQWYRTERMTAEVAPAGKVNKKRRPRKQEADNLEYEIDEFELIDEEGELEDYLEYEELESYEEED